MTPYGRQSSRVPRVPVAPMASAPWRNVAAAGLFVGLGWAAPQLGDRLSGPIAAAVAAPTSPETNTAPGVTFVAQATGVTLGAVDVYDAPAGGAVSAVLPQGAPVAIGGRILVPAGLWNRDVLWVRLSASGTKPDAATTAAYGFVPADTVAVTAGTPLRLGIDAVTRASLASPASAIQYAGGEGRAQITADVHVPSGAVPTLAAAPDPSEAAHAPVPGAADAPGIGAAADIGIAWLPETVARWQPDIVAAAAAHGIDPKLAAIVMLVESGGDPTALSPSGARGLMQVMPGTGADIARRRDISGFEPDMLADPATNLDFGAWYLAQQLGAFGIANDPDWQASVEAAAAAYNGGPGSVQRMRAGGSLPDETVRYQRWVGGMWRERASATSPTFDAWWQAGGSRLVAAAERVSAGR